MRRPYDVSLPLLTLMHYVHLVHGCAFVKWIGMRVDSGIRRIIIGSGRCHAHKQDL